MSANAETPQSQAITRAGKGGIVPPPDKRWKPGQSGNPGGMPKGTPSMTRAYAKILALSPADLKKFKPEDHAEAIAVQQIKRALTANLEYATAANGVAKEIADRLEGKAIARTADVSADEIGQKARALFGLLSRAADNLTNAVTKAITGIKQGGDVESGLLQLLEQVNLDESQIVSAVCAAFTEEQAEIVVRALGVE